MKKLLLTLITTSALFIGCGDDSTGSNSNTCTINMGDLKFSCSEGTAVSKEECDQVTEEGLGIFTGVYGEGCSDDYKLKCDDDGVTTYIYQAEDGQDCEDFAEEA